MMRKNQGGYILMYVLATMVILGGLALSVAFRERIGVQLVHNVVESAHDEYTYRSALAYTQAQMELSGLLEAPERVKDPAFGKTDRWQLGDARQINVGDSSVRVSLLPHRAEPDFNLFDDKEVARLFVNMGVPEADAADYAVKVAAARPAEGGFEDRDALLYINGIPSEWLGQPDDGKPKKEGAKPTLYDLATIGSKSKQIDLDATPLEVVAALSGLDADAMAKLQRLRMAGPVTHEAALATVGQALQPLLSSPDSMTVRMQIADGDSWANAELSRKGQEWQVDALDIRRGQPPADEPDDATAKDGKQSKDNKDNMKQGTT